MLEEFYNDKPRTGRSFADDVQIVDKSAMQLVTRPEKSDVLSPKTSTAIS